MNLNPFDILKNAQAIQQQFGKFQEDLKSISATGSAGGGIVKTTISGQFELLNIEIDPVAVDPRDVAMLQDLIIAAHADALVRIRDAIKEKLGPIAGELNIPGVV